MGKLICKDCKGTDNITPYPPGIFGDPRYRCNSCGKISITTDFVVPDFFDSITASSEVLAEKLVYQFIAYDSHGLFVSCWRSTLTGDIQYDTKANAIAATLVILNTPAKRGEE